MPCSIIWTGRFFCGVLGAEPLGERVMEDLVDLIGVFQTDCGDAGAVIRGRLAPSKIMDPIGRCTPSRMTF